jgi:hypothetical protein
MANMGIRRASGKARARLAPAGVDFLRPGTLSARPFPAAIQGPPIDARLSHPHLRRAARL